MWMTNIIRLKGNSDGFPMTNNQVCGVLLWYLVNNKENSWDCYVGSTGLIQLILEIFPLEHFCTFIPWNSVFTSLTSSFKSAISLSQDFDWREMSSRNMFLKTVLVHSSFIGVRKYPQPVIFLVVFFSKIMTEKGKGKVQRHLKVL